MASDFNWTARKFVDLPPRTIFQDGGKLCGNLYQPLVIPKGDPRLTCYQSGGKDDDYSGGHLITTESAFLSRGVPCTTVHARTFPMAPDEPRVIPARKTHAWTAFGVLGFSHWREDDDKPEGRPNGLGPLIDGFFIRAVIISDLANPFEVTPDELDYLQQQIDVWDRRAQPSQPFEHQ
jgi:hypothetical protein